MSEAAKYYAVYSQSQVDCGSGMWEWRAADGKLEVCTHVCPQFKCKHVVYSDRLDLGEVTEWIRTLREPQQRRKVVGG